MKNHLLYQQLDSITQGNGLQLIQEVDEVVALPKAKKKSVSKVFNDTITRDSIKSYGIKNFESIPSRKSEQLDLNREVEQEIINKEPTPLYSKVDAWQIIILVTTIVLVAFSKAFNLSRFRQLIKALFNYSVAQEVTREEKVFFHRANIWFSLTYVLTISLVIFQFGGGISDAAIEIIEFSFLKIASFIIGVYLIKFIGAKILFFVFEGNELSREYIFNVGIYNNLLGVILIPVLMIMYFTSIATNDVLMYILFPLLSFIYLLRLVRLSVLGINYKISYLYIFLYICTLEILPLVVLYRIFISK